MKLLILQKDADEVVDSAGGCRLCLKSPSRQGALHSHRHPAACQSLLTGASIKSKYEFTFMLIDSFISVANGEEKEFTFQCKYECFCMLPGGTKWRQVVFPIYFWAWPWQDTCFYQNWFNSLSECDLKNAVECLPNALWKIVFIIYIYIYICTQQSSKLG